MTLTLAQAMKTTLPEGLVSPCGLFAVFEAGMRKLSRMARMADLRDTFIDLGEYPNIRGKAISC